MDNLARAIYLPSNISGAEEGSECKIFIVDYNNFKTNEEIFKNYFLDAGRILVITTNNESQKEEAQESMDDDQKALGHFVPKGEINSERIKEIEKQAILKLKSLSAEADDELKPVYNKTIANLNRPNKNICCLDADSIESIKESKNKNEYAYFNGNKELLKGIDSGELCGLFCQSIKSVCDYLEENPGKSTSPLPSSGALGSNVKSH